MYVEKLEQMQYEKQYARIRYLNGRVNDIFTMIFNANSAADLQTAGLALKEFKESGEWKENVTAYDNMKRKWLDKLTYLKEDTLKRANTAFERVKEIESEPPIDLPTEEQQKKAEILARQIEFQFTGNKTQNKRLIDIHMKAVKSGNIVSALAMAEIYSNYTELFSLTQKKEIFENMKTEAQKAQERLNADEMQSMIEQQVECQKVLFRCRNMEKMIAENL